MYLLWSWILIARKYFSNGITAPAYLYRTWKIKAPQTVARWKQNRNDGVSNALRCSWYCWYCFLGNLLLLFFSRLCLLTHFSAVSVCSVCMIFILQLTRAASTKRHRISVFITCVRHNIPMTARTCNTNKHSVELLSKFWMFSNSIL